MPELSRRAMLGATATLLGAGVTAAQAAPAAEDPHSIGSVRDGKVELPALRPESETGGPVPNVEPPGRRLGVAVVGLGHLSLEQILPGFGQAKSVRVTALVSGHRDKALAVAAQHGVPKESVYDYASFDAIRDNPSVDLVYIVLPNSLHEEFTVRAAQAGKHVLCEKPMAPTAAACERMIKACADARVKLMIAYRMQYEATQRAAIAMARGGELGTLRLLQAMNGQNDSPGQWRQSKNLAGGGSLPDVGIYCLNAFRYLTGEEPVEVTGRVTRPPDDPRFREVEDVASFTATFPSGIVGVGTSAYSTHTTRTLQIMGDTASLTLDNAFAYEGLAMRLSRKVGSIEAVDGRRWPAKNQFATEMDHFADAIRSDRMPHTPGQEGLADIRAIEAIYQSAAAGGAPVMLPLIKGLDTTRGPAPATDAG